MTDVGRHQKKGATRRRRALLELPVEPSDEDLARDWTLSPADRTEILHCRGDDHRLRFAVQLCTLRAFGRLLAADDTVPTRILNHLGYQLGLSPVLFVSPPGREATELEHKCSIQILANTPGGPRDVNVRGGNYLDTHRLLTLLQMAVASPAPIPPRHSSRILSS